MCRFNLNPVENPYILHYKYTGICEPDTSFKVIRRVYSTLGIILLHLLAWMQTYMKIVTEAMRIMKAHTRASHSDWFCHYEFSVCFKYPIEMYACVRLLRCQLFTNVRLWVLCVCVFMYGQGFTSGRAAKYVMYNSGYNCWTRADREGTT